MFLNVIDFKGVRAHWIFSMDRTIKIPSEAAMRASCGER
jgi:hypothetical protein